MNFLAPAALAFAAALPAVVVFYLLKRKRVVRVIPSTLLWRRFLAESQASAPFQRLRHNWLLWLQLLLLALVVLALGRPYFAGRAGTAALLVVILDASASMQATDEKPNRFERARAGALALVESLRTGTSARAQQMLVMAAGATAEVKQSATSEKSALRRAIQSVSVTDSPTRLTEALRVAETLTRDKPDSEIHLFSDGAFEGLEEFATKGLRLVFHRVGQRGDNAGIVTLDVRANPEDPSKRAIFATVANPSSRPVSSTMDLLFDDQLVETRPIEIGPTNSTAMVFTASQPRDGVFTVRLASEDDLAVDNRASVVSLLPQPVRVLLVTRGNQFLEKALAAAGPNVEVITAGDHTGGELRPEVTVLDDVVPSRWPEGNILAIHVAATNWFEGGVGAVEGPPIVDWKNTHPLLRFVNLDNLQIAQSLAVRTPSWAVALVESPQTPLVLAGELGRQRIAWIGFDTLQSTWPLRISFPIFVANLVDWLNPATANAARFQVQAGDAFRLPLPEAVSEAAVTAPDGAVRKVPLDPKARDFVFGETSRQGVYRVALGTNRLAFCANLLDAAESQTRPHDEISMGRLGTVTATTLKRANLEHWRWFALGGLAVLMLEWWWFHRRTA